MKETKNNEYGLPAHLLGWQKEKLPKTTIQKDITLDLTRHLQQAGVEEILGENIDIDVKKEDN